MTTHVLQTLKHNQIQKCAANNHNIEKHCKYRKWQKKMLLEGECWTQLVVMVCDSYHLYICYGLTLCYCLKWLLHASQSFFTCIIFIGCPAILCPSYSRKSDFSETPWLKFWKFSTNIYLDSNMNLYGFGSHRSMSIRFIVHYNSRVHMWSMTWRQTIPFYIQKVEGQCLCDITVYKNTSGHYSTLKIRNRRGIGLLWLSNSKHNQSSLLMSKPYQVSNQSRE